MSRWARWYPVLCCVAIGAAVGSEAFTAVRALTGFGPLWFALLLELRGHAAYCRDLGCCPEADGACALAEPAP